MRHCYNEGVEVYQAEGRDLSDLLEDAAQFLRGKDVGWTNVTTQYDVGVGYILTLYVSG